MEVILDDTITEYIQRESLKILAEFHEICVENNLKYILDYGTLLGAIRHEGFIPWDDDVDVSMPREDYEKFILIIEDKIKNNQTNLFLQIKKTDSEYFLPLTKLRLENNNLREMALTQYEIVHGPWIDVFVFDNMPLEEKELQNILEEYNRKRKFIDLITPTMYDKNLPNQYWLKTFIKKQVIKLGKNKNRLFFNWIDKKYQSLENLILKAINMGDYSSSKMITYVFPIKTEQDLKTHTIYRESFNNRRLTKFEDFEFYIPSNYDLILKERYGNYHELPPIEERINKHQWDLEKLNLSEM